MWEILRINIGLSETIIHTYRCTQYQRHSDATFFQTWPHFLVQFLLTILRGIGLMNIIQKAAIRMRV